MPILPGMFVWRLVRFLFDTALILLIGAILSALFFQVTPGSDVNLRQLDLGLSEQSIAALQAENQQKESFPLRTWHRLVALSTGDFGISKMSGTPVSGLLRERLPFTVDTVVAGSLLGFVAGLALAVITVLLFPGVPEIVVSGAFLSLLSIPAGLLVLLAVFGNVPVALAVGATAAPRVYFYAARLFTRQRNSPWVLGAVASGLGSFRIAVFQILPSVRSELFALFGFAVVTALAAAIPAEVLTSRPGIGHLAWKSAMERDLPVVIAVTMVMILVARAVTVLSAVPDRDLRQTA